MGSMCSSCNDPQIEENISVVGTHKRMNDVVHFFMIGIEGAGKTTIIRQLKCLCTQKPSSYQMYDDNWHPIPPEKIFRSTELDDLHNVVRINLIAAFASLVKKTNEQGNKVQQEEAARRVISKWEEISAQGRDIYEHRVDNQIGSSIAQLFDDPQVSKTLSNHDSLAGIRIEDGTLYFVKDAERIRNIFDDSYTLSNEDIVHVRKPTVSFRSYRFKIKKTMVEIHDMGGQKTELARVPEFMRQFLSTNGHSFLLYVSSMSGFNEPSRDAPGKTVMDKSLKILELVLGLDGVEECSLMLFLNKQDRFDEIVEEKWNSDEGRQHLQKYLGDDHINWKTRDSKLKDRLKDSLSTRFQEMLKRMRKGHSYYIKYTQATDSQLMSSIFYAVENEIISAFFTRGHFLN